MIRPSMPWICVPPEGAPIVASIPLAIIATGHPAVGKFLTSGRAPGFTVLSSSLGVCR